MAILPDWRTIAILQRPVPSSTFLAHPRKFPMARFNSRSNTTQPVVIALRCAATTIAAGFSSSRHWTFQKTGDLPSDIRNGVQQLANIMEKYIRQYPDQWLVFQKIWEE
jgi:lauroyl/myristoyl acyltransferase